jgi:hypothetical protein
MVTFCDKTEQGLVGPQISRLCAGCHDPVNARAMDTSLSMPKGVTCLGCHEVTRPIRAGGNADLEVMSQDWTHAHAAGAGAALVTLRTADFCAGCHEQFVPGNGLGSILTYNEWNAGPFANGGAPAPCVTCHMPSVGNGVTDHSFPGGNVYLATLNQDTALAKKSQANLSLVAALSFVKNADGSFTVTVKNRGSGHAFPTGVTDIVEAWVELQAVSQNGDVLAKYGGVDPMTGVLPSTAARLGSDLGGADGGLLTRHELSQALSIPFDLRVPPGGSVDLTVAAPPAQLPSGTSELDAVLLYHNVRTTFYQQAVDAGTNGTVPALEMARVKLQ